MSHNIIAKQVLYIIYLKIIEIFSNFLCKYSRPQKFTDDVPGVTANYKNHEIQIWLEKCLLKSIFIV